MKSTIAALLLLAVTPAAAKTETEFALSEAHGTLHIARDGRVSRADLDTELDAENETGIEALVRRWQFEPVLENGEAVEAKVRARLVLVARTDGGRNGKTRIAVQGATFFEDGASADQRLVATLKPPRYPPFGQGTVGGTIYLQLLLREDGTVATVSLAGG